MNKAIFLDRDGVVNKPCYHDELGIYSPRTVDELIIFPYAKEACRQLKKLGYQLIVVSNQPGVAFGTIREEDLAEITARIQSEIPEIDAFYYCRHHPAHTGECDCRKPKDGLFRQAAEKRGVNLSASIMIGDNLSDILAAKGCACTILLADTRIDLLSIMEAKKVFPDYIAKDLSHAASIVQDINQNNNEEHTSRCDRCWRLGHPHAADVRKNS
ncbi:HAD-IIIA family hydrolase [Candidatus Peregrinibacteria bacterium]|nr:HAD-IIIA family hydrolase [Candidatus Peregrinibacteria bacterium]